MNLFVLILFIMNLSLLLVHEMDAARNAEWRMLPWLKSLQDADAHRIFTALHIPLYALLLYLLLGGYRFLAFFIVDIFLVLHAALHVLFHRHRQNNLKSAFSQSVIYAAGALAVLHLAMRKGW